VQGVLFHQVGTHPGQIALGQIREAPVQQFRHGQIQYRVAQKFKPLVVIRRKTSVRKRPLEKRGVCEFVLQTPLQL
jgi:hypothetical protein